MLGGCSRLWEAALLMGAGIWALRGLPVLVSPSCKAVKAQSWRVILVGRDIWRSLVQVLLEAEPTPMIEEGSQGLGSGTSCLSAEAAQVFPHL